MKKLPITRIPYYKDKLLGKTYLTMEEVYKLCDGKIIITEKIDGHAELDVKPMSAGSTEDFKKMLEDRWLKKYKKEV